MAITDNPLLNEKINGKDEGKDISKARYCNHCGKQLIFTTTDEDGSTDRSFEYRWKNKICKSCFVEQRSGNKESKSKYRKL